MKEIMKKMVQQEIKHILAENEPSIKEMVRASLLPQIRAVIRNEIRNTLSNLMEPDSEALKREALIQENPHAQSIESEIPESTPPATPEHPAIHHTAGGQICNSHLSPLNEPQARDGGQAKSKIGLYLYCIAEGARETTFGAMGIEENQVYAIPFGELSAIVHDCSAEPYHSDDHDKVKAWVLTHQKVVDAAWERFGTVIPMGFDTIICGKEDADPKENIKKWIEADYDNLSSKMGKIRNNAEYGVQVFWETSILAKRISAESVEIKRLQEEIRTKPRGIAYMYRQKLEELLKNEMAKNADQCFQEFYEKIRPYTQDLHVEKTKAAEEEGKQMLLNLSCLLPKDRSKKLGEALEEIDGREGFSVRFTGPWPPYSFV